MKKINLFNKNNIVVLVLFIILNFIILFGMSYYIGITKFWFGMTSNHYLFRTYLVKTDDIVTNEEILNSLKNNIHVLDSYTNDEYRSYAVINEFKTDEKNGNIGLIGTIPNTKKIIYGRDLSEDNKYEIICSNDFFPDSTIYSSGSFNVHKSINLKDRINTTILVDFMEMKEVAFTLVGLYDRGYDYSNPYECYISHETMKELNNELQEKINEKLMDYFNDPSLNPEDVKGTNIFILIDDNKNIDTILDIPGVVGYEQGIILRTDKGDKILIITGVLAIGMIWMVFILSLLIYKRKIMKDFKNIGIMIIIGYSIKKIKEYKYKESIAISIFAFFISLILTAISLKLYKAFFLYNDPELVLTPLNLSIIAILISIIITLITSFISTHFALKRINEMEVLDIIYE